MATTHEEGLALLREEMSARGISKKNAEKVAARICAVCPDRFASSLDAPMVRGLVAHAIDQDARDHAADHRPVPEVRALLDAACNAYVKKMGLPSMPPMERIAIYRELQEMDEDALIAKAQEIGFTASPPTAKAVPMAAAPSPEAPRKRFADMNPDEMEVEITKRWGPPGPHGRLASDTRRFRDFLIESERDKSRVYAARELNQLSGLQRDLTPAERITLHRAKEKVKA